MATLNVCRSWTAGRFSFSPPSDNPRAGPSIEAASSATGHLSSSPHRFQPSCLCDGAAGDETALRPRSAQCVGMHPLAARAFCFSSSLASLDVFSCYPGLPRACPAGVAIFFFSIDRCPSPRLPLLRWVAGRSCWANFSQIRMPSHLIT